MNLVVFMHFSCIYFRYDLLVKAAFLGNLSNAYICYDLATIEKQVQRDNMTIISQSFIIFNMVGGVGGCTLLK